MIGGKVLVAGVAAEVFADVRLRRGNSVGGSGAGVVVVVVTRRRRVLPKRQAIFFLDLIFNQTFKPIISLLRHSKEQRVMPALDVPLFEFIERLQVLDALKFLLAKNGVRNLLEIDTPHISKRRCGDTGAAHKRVTVVEAGYCAKKRREPTLQRCEHLLTEGVIVANLVVANEDGIFQSQRNPLQQRIAALSRHVLGHALGVNDRRRFEIETVFCQDDLERLEVAQIAADAAISIARVAHSGDQVFVARGCLHRRVWICF